MKLRFIILLTAVILLLGACASSQHGNTDPSDTLPPDDLFGTEPSGDATESTQNTEPSETEATLPPVDAVLLGELTEEFSEWTSPYNMTLICEFSCPEELPLSTYLCDGRSANLTDEEWAQLPAFNPNLGAYRFTPEYINDALTQYFGITIDDLSKESLETLIYLESTGCYYLQTGLNYLYEFTLISSEALEDGTIRIHYTDRDQGPHVVTMKPLDGRYVFVSNLPA